MKIIFLVLLSLTTWNCGQEPSVTGEFKGFWATTWWTLTLQSNNKFEFVSAGHFGDTKTKGIFSIDGSFIELLPEDESSIKMVFKNYKFKILGDSCLADADHGYDYCRVRPDQWRSRVWDLEKNKIVTGYRE